MICPNCKQIVEPQCGTRWLVQLDAINARFTDGGQPATADEILRLVQDWDQSVMYTSGRSVIPIELRDAMSTYNDHHH